MKRGIKEMNIILASGSPRRKELLAQAGFDFEVEVSNADENVAEESPTEMVEKPSLIFITKKKTTVL